MSRPDTVSTEAYTDIVMTANVRENNAAKLGDGVGGGSQTQKTNSKDVGGWPGSHGLKVVKSSMPEWKGLPSNLTGGVTQTGLV